MADYEKLGAFYLGRRYDVDAGEVSDEQILYDAKDLTTHAVCVGMTGSGKTGLGVALIEEAALDGVPVIAIDPKGDLGNLLLTFPKLRAQDFAPWIDASEAARKGRTPEEHAQWTADLWRKGLGEWGQDGERIQRFRDAAEATIYTPGSSAGRPLTVLRSFNAPAQATLDDSDAFRDRIESAVAGLLGLLGIAADPLRSREHILLATIFDKAWREGRDLDLGALIRAIQDPPFERVGVLDLESFYPASKRFELAIALNNLVASPGFSAWTEGDPLDVGKLLYTDEGKPRLSIISIAHLSESERMFFVTLLLGEVLAWTRAQPGSRSLRAILYMDEVFGYFPPTANPPSKKPMLTLLKQARAYGVGCVLATQNPVDLDYKGLSNAGTWFLGRLQTERDKARVIEGLEGASAQAGSSFDKARMEQILAGLDSRVFVMNNVHEDAPVVFHTRWVLSYLAGPLTREQIRGLVPDQPESDAKALPPAAKRKKKAGARGKKAAVAEPDKQRPVLEPDVAEAFLPLGLPASAGTRLLYRPALMGTATVHYVSARAKIDEWRKVTMLAPLDSDAVDPWEAAVELGAAAPETTDDPAEAADFGALPSPATPAKTYKRWTKMLQSHVYKSRPLRLMQCKALKKVSAASESEAEFYARLKDEFREKRDDAMDKLRSKYATKIARIEDQVRRAEERVDREKDQYSQQKTQTAISVGSTILGALFGRKLGGVSSVGRATTAMRGAGRAASERGDVRRAVENVEALQEKLDAMEAELNDELQEIRDEFEADDLQCEELLVSPRKSDLAVESLVLVWTPWLVDADGVAKPGFTARSS